MEEINMSKLQTPFRYDFVGSFLRPEKLKKARRQFDEGAIDYAALKVVEDECILELAAKIKALGYHVITDGEFRTGTWISCGDLMALVMCRPRQDCHFTERQQWLMTLIS